MTQIFNTLDEVANKIRNIDKKTILIYGFNATGKTRLSMIFKNLINSNNKRKRLIYFNAFTEDLFYWDNDIANNQMPIMKINTTSTFINTIKNQGKDQQLIELFQYHSNSKITPLINFDSGEISFLLGPDKQSNQIKISRGEETLFIWCMFQILLETIVDELNQFEEDRSTSEFNDLEYIYIDDPISSLDDNHCINLGIDIAELIRSSSNEKLKFIISTHYPIFYNVLHNELKNSEKLMFKRLTQGYQLVKQYSDSPFAHHLVLKNMLEEAVDKNQIYKIHFNLLRHLLEKTATFLGYKKWSDCIMIEENKKAYVRQINLYSHSSRSDTEMNEIPEHEKELFKLIFNSFKKQFIPEIVEKNKVV